VSSSPLTHLFQEELYTVPPVVTILINKSWEQLPDDHKTLLSKILGSVKVSLAATRILHRDRISADELKSLGAPRVLIFGTQADVGAYEHIQAQGFSVIRADEFGALDDAKKKSLWVALKGMFSA
jgi:DNA polymerase III psi subunit